MGTIPNLMGKPLCTIILIELEIASSEGADDRSSTNTRFQVFRLTVCN
jgi:hypothetical protein